MVGVVRDFGLLVGYLLCCLVDAFEVVQTGRHGYLGLLLLGSVSGLVALIRVTPTTPYLPHRMHCVAVVRVPPNVRKGVEVRGREPSL